MTEEMKKCKYCGREIGAAATFCWYCGRELEARPERPDAAPPESRLDRWLILGAGIVVLILVLALVISALLK
jgi:predicted amidophosphoribosyltransferase